MTISPLQFNYQGLLRGLVHIGTASVIGGGGQIFLPGGSIGSGVVLLAIGAVLMLAGNFERGDKP